MRYHFHMCERSDGCIYLSCFELFSCRARIEKSGDPRTAASQALAEYLDSPAPETLFPYPSCGSLRRIREIMCRVHGEGEILKISASPAAALSIQLRRIRADRKIFQADAAIMLGCKNIAVYQRLERPKRANPTLRTLADLKRIFPELDFNKLF